MVIPVEDIEHLKSLRIQDPYLGDFFPFDYWKVETLPSWTQNLLIKDEDDFCNVNYLLTFRPFNKLPTLIKEKYLTGN